MDGRSSWVPDLRLASLLGHVGWWFPTLQLWSLLAGLWTVRLRGFMHPFAWDSVPRKELSQATSPGLWRCNLWVEARRGGGDGLAEGPGRGGSPRWLRGWPPASGVQGA